MWLLILTVIIFNSIFILMPKRLTPIEIFSTCMFAMVLQQIVDVAFDLKLDWYGYFAPGVQWPYLLAITGIYPAVNAIFLNYYQYLKSRSHKFWYIIACSVFAVFYEWFATEYGYFYHNEWRLWHSALVYPFLYLILIWILNSVRKMVEKSHL